jgi:Cu(I)/Ag(I) efflux system protein CusF
MKPVTIILFAGSALMLSACGDKATTDGSAEANQAAAASAASGATGGAMATGTGTVTAIDKASGKITLDHGPIAEAGWPAMTMAFDAKPAVLDSVVVGDKVVFDLILKDGSGEVAAIRKQ